MKTNQISMTLLKTILLTGGITCLISNVVTAESPENAAIRRENVREEARARMGNETTESQIDASATLQKSTELYSSVVKGSQGQVPESILAKAQCVVVIPDLMTGALVIGGSHGVGIGTCRENNQWSAPAFLKMNAVSLGAQIGGKSSDLILFVIDDKAKTALRKGSLTLGKDASVIAGTFDKSMDTSTHGVIAYARSEGAFVGASLSQGNITSDDADTSAFYGKEVNYISLLSGHVATKQNNQVDQFIALLPR